MNVIPKFYNTLPSHWQDYIRDKDWFELKQFNSHVWIQFEDGSHCFFNYAFMVVDEEREELAVFTEHCGYYIFGTRGLERYKQMNYKKSLKVKTKKT